jgi:acyl-coenzyme A synthetase/AMP-(fatty) acid ligase
MVAVEAAAEDVGPIASMLSETLALPKSAIRVEAVSSLPRTMTGKIDYQALPAWKDGHRAIMAGQFTQ